MLDIIGKRKIFLAISATLVAASIGAIAFWGLDFGIDFTGGSLMEIAYQQERPSNSEIRETLSNLPIGTVQVQPTDEQGAILRFSPVNEETHQLILSTLQETGELTEERFESIGPVIGSELRERSIEAIIIVIILIVFYVAWAFRKVSSQVSSWKYGLVTIVALAHDIVIPTGVVAVIGYFGSFQVDSFFIAALLTILGFSVQDTIVVFDRIRENLLTASADNFAEIANRSVNEVLARSINTSATLLLVLFAVFFFGGTTVQNLVFVLILGTFLGAYSSIFLATPLLVTWALRGQRKET